MNPYDYYCLTPYEFWCKCEGYEQQEVKKWHHTRWITYIEYCANTKPNDRVSIEKFMPLPDDKTDMPLNKSEREKLKEVFLKAMQPNGRLSTT